MNLKILGVALSITAIVIMSLVVYAGYETSIRKNQLQEMTRNISDGQNTGLVRVEAMRESVKTEVKYIYVETKNQVAALSGDAVAVSLNDELAVWRGVDSGAAGVSHP
ncbi:hypothetical protein FACS1894187_10900 [Synergistales bacterium]|nr:hypothetical protein FACS1894187_10900 [Synergistales bacterium]